MRQQLASGFGIRIFAVLALMFLPACGSGAAGYGDGDGSPEEDGQPSMAEDCSGDATDGLCDPSSTDERPRKRCAPETDAQFCARLGKNCGALSGSDNCHRVRAVASCGTCTAPETCGGGGVSNVCGAPPILSSCPNGTADPGEACDGADLRGATCVTQGFVSGTLACLTDCSAYDTSACVAGVAPAQPLAPTYTEVTAASLRVNWVAVSGASSYVVERGPDNGGVPGAWLVRAAAETGVSFMDTGLSSATKYWYRVRANNSYGSSPFSTASSVTTAAEPQPSVAPRRSWIKLGLIAYQSSMTASQIQWTATHFDWFDSPRESFLAPYKASTGAPMLVYDNYYCLYVGQAKYNAMVAYCAAHGHDVEAMFIHYAEPTTVTFGSETHTLAAGSRVPSYGWYGTGGDLLRSGARIIVNPGNPAYRAFNAEYARSLVSTPHSGATYDGLFVDNSGPAFVFKTRGSISSGGSLAEYPGTTASSAFDADLVQTFAAAHTAIAPKAQWPNGAVRSWGRSWLELFPYIEGAFNELGGSPASAQTDAAHFQATIANLRAAHDAGISVVITSNGTGVTSTDLPGAKMASLALYYLAATPSSYFCRQDSTGGDPHIYAWFPALEYDVGQPLASFYVLQHGTDPANGSAAYDVLARMYEHVLVVHKGKTASGVTGPSSYTTHALPAPADNPTGVYYRLQVDGTVDSATPLRSITLGNTEGAVLVKATAL